MMIKQVVTSLNLAVVVTFVLLLALSPVLFDTRFVPDLALLANLGWRWMHGIAPVVDYPHFHGGVMAWVMGQSMKLFGASYKSIDYGFLILFFGAAASVTTLAWGRISGLGLSVLLALSAALILSLHAVEFGHTWVGATHAFAYNHVAIVLVLGMICFALGTGPGQKTETGAGLLAGVTLYVVVMLKPTFVVFGPFLVLACLVQGRVRAAGLVLLGAVIGMLLMDFGLTRISGAFEALASGDAAQKTSDISFFLFNILRMVLAQSGALLLCGVLIGMLFLAQGRRATPFVGAAILCGLGYGAVVLTTGGNAEQKLLPLIAVVVLMGCERLRATPSETQNSPTGLLLMLLPACLAYGLIGPALFSATYSTLRAVQSADKTLIEDGAFASYFVYGDTTADPRFTGADAATRRAAGLAIVTDNVAQGIPLTESDEYVLFADGVALLQTIPEVTTLGVIANSAVFEFSFSVGSQPISSYSVWPTPGLPDMTGVKTLGADVDLVMMIDDAYLEAVTTPDLLRLMGPAFQICRTTPIWTLYARRSMGCERLNG